MSSGGGTLSVSRSKPNIIKTQFLYLRVYRSLNSFHRIVSLKAQMQTCIHSMWLEASRWAYVPVTTILRYMVSEKYHLSWRPEVATPPRKWIYVCTHCKKWDSSCHRNKLQQEMGLSQGVTRQEVLNLDYSDWCFSKRNYKEKKEAEIKEERNIGAWKMDERTGEWRVDGRTEKDRRTDK